MSSFAIFNIWIILIVMANVSEKKIFLNENLKKFLSREEIAAVEKDSDELLELGFASVELGDYEKAYNLFMTNMEVNGSSPDGVNGLAISIAELGHMEKALEIMKYAAGLYPNDAITIANLAGIYWEVYEYEKSIYYFNQSLKLNPDLIETHFNLINVYYESGDIYMAYIASCTAVKEFPDDEEAVQIRNDILLDMAISLH
jgi:tetratricopeptide (TPR) repeat protein